MAKSTEKAEGRGEDDDGDEEDDYMGDLSRFIPPEETIKKGSSTTTSTQQQAAQTSSKKSVKVLSWQERRKLDRDRKQQEEDELTLARIEAPISESNVGFKLLKQMGYTPGLALGKEGVGRVEPVGIEIRRSRAGIGREDPHKEKRKREEMREESKRRKEDFLREDFGVRQKEQWRNKRVVINFHKAKVSLDQLEDRDVLPVVQNEDEVADKEEEEEEEITEEDLVALLTKLRDEHNYCLFCGYQYSTQEEMLSSCPGRDEDDH
ncbi:hypothetical protein MLD38_026004 [Melastoma candidum]|uniref:Uncharacterized protein n=1 Tax=Melastoma candidum TaxID=119954 RepID=A0ACB9NX78_9MYRT|nr:hypothetical protein MLD38_026004 [Melastoma candidum]